MATSFRGINNNGILNPADNYFAALLRQEQLKRIIREEKKCKAAAAYFLSHPYSFKYVRSLFNVSVNRFIKHIKIQRKELVADGLKKAGLL